MISVIFVIFYHPKAFSHILIPQQQQPLPMFTDHLLPFTEKDRVLTTLRRKPLKTVWEKKTENFVAKGENAVYQHFLLFPRCFPSY